MDRFVSSPMSVFTVEEPRHHGSPSPSPARRSVCCTLLMQLVLMLFALLALIAAASQVYYLWRVQANLDASQDMVNTKFDTQHMNFIPAFRHGPIPSAHLTGQMDKDTSPLIPLQWESIRGLAFLHEIEYNNGSLRCKKSGLYFVYSKLQLGVACPKQTDPLLFFTHSVNKRSMDSVTPLMEDKGGFCNSQSSPAWKKSSFLGSMVLLEEGDEIYVNMSHRKLIRAQANTATFFGLFML
ncbi:tumor necrosis factor ligand superfamily member 14-like [Mantella aurantiaca]